MAKVFHPCRTPAVESISVLIKSPEMDTIQGIWNIIRTHPCQTRSGTEIRETATAFVSDTYRIYDDSDCRHDSGSSMKVRCRISSGTRLGRDTRQTTRSRGNRNCLLIHRDIFNLLCFFSWSLCSYVHSCSFPHPFLLHDQGSFLRLVLQSHFYKFFFHCHSTMKTAYLFAAISLALSVSAAVTVQDDGCDNDLTNGNNSDNIRLGHGPDKGSNVIIFLECRCLNLIVFLL